MNSYITLPVVVGSLLLLAWIVMVTLFLWSVKFRRILGNDVGAVVLTAIGAGAGYLFLNAFEENRKAQTAALALTSDVAAIMRVIHQGGIARNFMLQFASPGEQYVWPGVERKEDYFAVFHAQVGNLGALREERLVADVTRFYTFLKASRDAASPLLGATRSPVSNHQVRMLSFKICKILETTMNAGIEVIETFKEAYGSSGDPDIDKDREAAMNTVEEVRTFVSFWDQFLRDHDVEYRKEGDAVLDKRINESEFFDGLKRAYLYDVASGKL